MLIPIQGDVVIVTTLPPTVNGIVVAVVSDHHHHSSYNLSHNVYMSYENVHVHSVINFRVSNIVNSSNE